LRQRPDAVLIDVRSSAEWDFVGRCSGPWRSSGKSYPGMQPTPSSWRQLDARVPKDAVAMFTAAAAGAHTTRRWWQSAPDTTACFNVLEGFEVRSAMALDTAIRSGGLARGPGCTLGSE